MCFFKTPFLIDKIIQERIKMFFEPVFEPKMVDESYEFKLGRFAHLALKTICK
jgi:retron-type reverse transcriptase